MVTKNISMRFQHSPIKTVGGVRKSTKKCLKMTSFWPGTEKRKIGQPRNLYPEVTFTPIHLLVKFRDDRTSGKWSKSPDLRTQRVCVISNGQKIVTRFVWWFRQIFCDVHLDWTSHYSCDDFSFFTQIQSHKGPTNCPKSVRKSKTCVNQICVM